MRITLLSLLLTLAFAASGCCGFKEFFAVQFVGTADRTTTTIEVGAWECLIDSSDTASWEAQKAAIAEDPYAHGKQKWFGVLEVGTDNVVRDPECRAPEGPVIPWPWGKERVNLFIVTVRHSNGEVWTDVVDCYAARLRECVFTIGGDAGVVHRFESR